MSKRRKVPHESSEEDDLLAVPAPTGKRRKVAVEVMLSAAKGKGKQNVPDDHSLYEVRSTSSPVVPSPPRQVTKIGPSKRSKPSVIVSSESDNDLGRPTASNEVTKIGPPRKRRARPEDAEASTVVERAPSPQVAMKIGPPRGVKRKQRPSSPQVSPVINKRPTSKVASDSLAIDAPFSEDYTALEQGHEVSAEEIGLNANADKYWQYDFDNERAVSVPVRQTHDIFSREGIVPETQSSPQSPEAPPALALRPRSLQTAASAHKSKPRNDSGTNSTTRPAPASPRVAIRDQTVEGIASRRDKTLVDSRTTKTATKVMRPIPVVSPSVFHPHLPEPDPPLSSIEQFSSPEKGGVHATSMAIRRAEKRLKEKGKGRQVASKWDDETLQLRGQQLADEAASSRHSSSRSPPLDEDNDWLFEMPSNPGSPQNADEDVLIGPSPIPSSPRGTSISVDPVAQEVVDAFINFGDEPEDGWGLATLEEQAMTLGPDLSAARRKAGPLQQLRGSRFEVRVLCNIGELEVDFSQASNQINP